MPRKKLPAAKPRSSETYSLRLTELQRSSLIHSTRIRNKIKERLKAAGEGTQIVGVTRKELDHLNEEIGEAAVFIPDPHKKRLVAVLHQVTGLLDGERAVPFGTDTSNPRKAAPKNGAVLYQFKITLLDIKPAIWRRIQVPDCTLLDLHLCIQAAFGWWNYHLHQFLIDGRRYGLPDPEDFDFGDRMVDGSGAVLSKLIPKAGRRSRLIYEYDFGDGWRHEVLFEGFPPVDAKAKYPLCVEGERACPPEDCGGPGGYAEYLVAIADPQHEQHDDLLNWRGPFDPEAFDPKKATK